MTDLQDAYDDFVAARDTLCSTVKERYPIGSVVTVPNEFDGQRDPAIVIRHFADPAIIAVDLVVRDAHQAIYRVMEIEPFPADRELPHWIRDRVEQLTAPH